MSKIRLSEHERALLGGIQFDAAKPVDQIARQLKMRSHTVHYYLKQLYDKKIIRAVALVNPAALGLYQYTVYFSIAPDRKQTRI